MKNIVRKLSEVMAEVDRIPKNGRNDFHKYDYATEADIVSAVRAAMAKRQLMLVPSVVSKELRTDGKSPIVVLTVRFSAMDGESGEVITFDVVGEGQDAGDKGSYKAMTGATKYALLKLFLIPTGDDPEEDERPSSRGNHQTQPRESAQPKAQPQQTQSGPAPYDQIVAAAKEFGKNEEWAKSIIKGTTQKQSASQLVQADVEIVKRAMQFAYGAPNAAGGTK